MLSLLLLGGLFFWAAFESIVIFVMFVVTVALIGVAVILFVVTAKAGFKQDFLKQNIVSQNLIFEEWGITVESIDPEDKVLYVEKYKFVDFDKVALRKDKVYLFPGISTAFYIYPSSVTEGDYNDLRIFLIDHVDKSKFKMKTKIKQFPGYSRARSKKDYPKDNNTTGTGE